MRKAFGIFVSLLLFFVLNNVPAYADAEEFNADVLKESDMYSYDSEKDTWIIKSRYYEEYDNGELSIILLLASPYVEKGWGPDLRVFSYYDSEYETIDKIHVTVDDKIYSFEEVEKTDDGDGGLVFGGEVMRAMLNSLSGAKLVKIVVDCLSETGEPSNLTIKSVDQDILAEWIELAELFEEANLWDPAVTTDLEYNDEYYKASIADNEEYDENQNTATTVPASDDSNDDSSDDDGSADTSYGNNPYISIFDVARPDKTDIVLMGSYEQDGNRENGAEPIQWIVLESDGQTLTLISRYTLDRIPYQEGYVDVTWENCGLRSWMNDTFLNEAFSEEERAIILPVESDNSNNYESSTMWRTIKAGNDTEDRVFTLSCMQAESLFGHQRGYSGGYNQTVLKNYALSQPTEYAKSQGVTTDEHGNCYWWLRSPSVNTYYAYYVSPLAQEGATYTFSSHIGVRPVIRVDYASIGNKGENTSLSKSGAVEVVDFKYEYSEFMNEYRIYFTLKNKSSISLDGLEAKMVFMDSKGKILNDWLSSEINVRSGQSGVVRGDCDGALAPASVYIDYYRFVVDGKQYKDPVEDPYIYKIK